MRLKLEGPVRQMRGSSLSQLPSSATRQRPGSRVPKKLHLHTWEMSLWAILSNPNLDSREIYRIYILYVIS